MVETSSKKEIGLCAAFDNVEDTHLGVEGAIF
jgi:hypothetical protein